LVVDQGTKTVNSCCIMEQDNYSVFSCSSPSLTDKQGYLRLEIKIASLLSIDSDVTSVEILTIKKF